MPGTFGAKAWILYTKSSGRDPYDYQYDDSTGNFYSYDSNVPNSKQIRVGDIVVVRTDDDVAGWGIIERIDVTPNFAKLIRRCPACDATNPRVLERTTGYTRCDRCRLQFLESETIISQTNVTSYCAYYANSWIESAPAIEARELREIEDKVNSQLAIRSVDISKLPEFLERISARPVSMDDEIQNLQPLLLQGGHTEGLSRRRRGQRAFRFEMLRRYGEVCAFSGRQPPQVLEAAHLYSYASVGVHRVDGGLLLRRDYHSLFDAKLLAVNPSSLRIEVAPQLQDFVSYRRLQGLNLQLQSATTPSIDLLADHYEKAQRVFSQN